MIQALPIQRGATLMESFLFVPETVYASKIESLYEPLFMKAKVGSEGLLSKTVFNQEGGVCIKIVLLFQTRLVSHKPLLNEGFVDWKFENQKG